MRNLLCTAVVVAGGLFALGVHAQITYDVAFNSSEGNGLLGTGALILSAAPSASGLTTYTNAGPTDTLMFSVNLGGDQFYEGAVSGPESATFNNGQFTGLFLSAEAENNIFDDLSISGDAYNFSSFFGTSDTGAIDVTPEASTVTPEPSSIALLGTGILAGFGILRRRYT